MSRYINLYAKRANWAVYNTGGPYSGAYAVGYLNPSLYGGLSYKILESLGNDLYVIATESFGRVAIYVPNDTEGLTWPYAFYTDSTYYGAVSNPTPSQPGNPVPTPGITGNYLNLHPHMQSWAIYNVGGPYVSNSKIGTLSPATYGGLSYKIIGSKGNDILIIQTESFGQVAIYAPVDADSSRTSNPTYHNYNSVIIDPGDSNDYVESGSFLNLHPHMASWAVYNENVSYTSAYLVGRLSPQEFGGLSYKVLGNPVNDIYLIQTEAFGKVGIYAPRDEDSSLTTSPQYRDGDFGNPVPSGPGGTSTSPVAGNYLNLNPHMNSWGVYNPNGPYVSAHAIGHLAPAQYGGLSYAVVGNPALDVYIIQTESFGRVGIYAPADEDSSLSHLPKYEEGSTSIESDISYIYDGIELDGEGVVDIKPRSYWGASGTISSGMSGTRSLAQLSHIVVHHTAGYGSNDVSYMKAVQDYQQSLGWGDIGYHFAIGKSGVIMQGRSVNYVGAHAKQPMNTIALGVTLLGNFEFTMPTSAQVNSLVRLLSFLCNKYNISPSNIIGHRDVPGPAGSTTCPGNRFYNATNALSAIRNKVKSSQTTSLTKNQKDQQVKTFVQNKLNYSKYDNIMPKIIGYGVETWSPLIYL